MTAADIDKRIRALRDIMLLNFDRSQPELSGTPGQRAQEAQDRDTMRLGIEAGLDLLGQLLKDIHRIAGGDQ
jgi:hypothetical protein